jgi:hypothetical protein
MISMATGPSPCCTVIIYLFIVTSAQLRSRCDVWLALKASLQTVHHVFREWLLVPVCKQQPSTPSHPSLRQTEPCAWICLQLAPHDYIQTVGGAHCLLFAGNGARAHGARAKAGTQSFFLSFFLFHTVGTIISWWLGCSCSGSRLWQRQ